MYVSGDFGQIGETLDLDQMRGKNIVMQFYAAMDSHWAFDSDLTGVENWLADGNHGKLLIIYDGLGLQANSLKMSAAQVDEAMQALASSLGGKLPTNVTGGKWNLLNRAIGERAKNPKWSEAIKYSVNESLKQIAEGAQSIGTSVMTTGKVASFLLPALPFVALAGLFFYLKGTKLSDLTSKLRKP